MVRGRVRRKLRKIRWALQAPMGLLPSVGKRRHLCRSFSVPFVLVFFWETRTVERKLTPKSIHSKDNTNCMFSEGVSMSPHHFMCGDTSPSAPSEKRKKNDVSCLEALTRRTTGAARALHPSNTPRKVHRLRRSTPSNLASNDEVDDILRHWMYACVRIEASSRGAPPTPAVLHLAVPSRSAHTTTNGVSRQPKEWSTSATTLRQRPQTGDVVRDSHPAPSRWSTRAHAFTACAGRLQYPQQTSSCPEPRLHTREQWQPTTPI